MDAMTLQQAQAGDASAMEAVLTEIAPSVHRFGMRMCRHPDDADEVLQDTLIEIADKLPTFEGRSSLSSWVFTLARTACARRRRGLKNQPFVPEDEAPEPVDERGSPEDATLARDLRERVDQALDRLPPQFREVIELRDVEGLSAKEAAIALDIGVDALKSRLHRARSMLREELRLALDPPARPDCPDIAAAFSQKLEGDLAESDCAEMERHLAGCPSCEATCHALRSALATCRAGAASAIAPAVQATVRAAVRQWASQLAKR